MAGVILQPMISKLHFKKIWVIFFFIKVFYMLFAITVYSKLTTLGDTFDYLNAPLIISPKIFYSSTPMMQFLGSLLKTIFKLDVLACIPFMLLSFYGIYYAVVQLNLYRYAVYILILFSLPNFGVWTSILGKEAVGCFSMSVIAVIIIKRLRGKYRLKPIHYLALYLCFVFKPQYLIFVLQTLVFLWITNRFADKRYFPFILGSIIILMNLLALYMLRDYIDSIARGMAIHFRSNDPNLAQSTRSEDPWIEPYGIFKSAPYGMFIAFFGPTISEMLSKPTQLLAGLESLAMFGCFALLAIPRLRYNLTFFRFNPKVFISCFIIFAGILFIHYPFGFLNPGSAIRYRSNFYPLFVFITLYFFTYNDKQVRLLNVRPLTVR